MITHIRKGIYGWTADTQIPLDNGRELRFTTMKRSNGMVTTTVQCGKIEDKFFTYVMFQDFNARLISDVARATEKAVTQQHQNALAMLDDVKQACSKFYAAKV